MEDSNYKHKNEFEVNYDNLKNWYDGYRLKDEEKIYDIYSPYSIIKALEKKKVGNYWNESSNSNIVKKFFNIGIFKIRNAIAMLLDDKKIKIDVSTYKNDTTEFESRDDILTLFVHFGYLGYNEDEKEVYIPNKEVYKQLNECKKDENWSIIFKKYEKCKDLLEATFNCDEDKVAEIIEYFHNENSSKNYYSEESLRSAVKSAYNFVDGLYSILDEVGSGRGIADIVFIPSNKNRPALIIELKCNKDPEKAINQINQRKYYERLKIYENNLYLMGISCKKVTNTDENYKKHFCKIVKYEPKKKYNN